MRQSDWYHSSWLIDSDNISSSASVSLFSQLEQYSPKTRKQRQINKAARIVVASLQKRRIPEGAEGEMMCQAAALVLSAEEGDLETKARAAARAAVLRGGCRGPWLQNQEDKTKEYVRSVVDGGGCRAEEVLLSQLQEECELLSKNTGTLLSAAADEFMFHSLVDIDELFAIWAQAAGHVRNSNDAAEIKKKAVEAVKSHLRFRSRLQIQKSFHKFPLLDSISNVIVMEVRNYAELIANNLQEIDLSQAEWRRATGNFFLAAPAHELQIGERIVAMRSTLGGKRRTRPFRL